MAVWKFLLGTFGAYEPTGGRFSYDCVSAHSFGTETGPTSANASIRYFADHAVRENPDAPVVMDRMLADSFSLFGTVPDKKLVVGGPISNAIGKGVGTWGVLEFTKRIMDERGLSRPLLVGQAFHIGRIALQARTLGMDPVVHFGMPRQFDRQSKQVWTKSPALWVPHELIGAPWLKIQGEL